MNHFLFEIAVRSLFVWSTDVFISSSGSTTASVKRRASKTFKWQQFFRLQDGDILINSTGTGTMGRIGYYESAKLKPEYPFMVPDSHVTVARLGVGVVPKYIYYAMRSSFLQKAMEKQFRGTTNQKEFYINSVAATPIPLPPTKTQELIVATLDSSYAILRSIDEKQVHYSNNLHDFTSQE